jgi:hypothetical protein
MPLKTGRKGKKAQKNTKKHKKLIKKWIVLKASIFNGYEYVTTIWPK